VISATSVTEAEDLLSALEPESPLIRFTQQNPAISPVKPVLIICAGSDPAARIGTHLPSVRGTGEPSRFGGERNVCRSADVNGTRELEGNT
jgi:hypothetical protein